jgi:FdhD protein
MPVETRSFPIHKLATGGLSSADDLLAVEEPLEIRLAFGTPRQQKAISITMRTPGEDAALAVGFLYGEGIVRATSEIEKIEHCGPPNTVGALNTIRVDLKGDAAVDLKRLERHFYTTSSCGVCGKSSIEALQSSAPPTIGEGPSIHPDTLLKLPGTLREQQNIFASTGGLHASALFTADGELLALHEDVGRHNALDKLIGSAFLRDELPLRDRVLLLSGRASFELVQKALMAGISFIAAVGAPSSLAVELAGAHGMTLVGFLREGRFNVYCREGRVSS